MQKAYSNAFTEKLKSLDNKYRNVMFVSLDHHEKYVSDLSLYVDFFTPEEMNRLMKC